MMGDNRDNSNDSRFWGTVKMDLVKGHAMFLYLVVGSGAELAARWNRLFQPIR